jgi:UDP-3-O-[3-hydroxymyristoyl] N-acetylglucosamine deacetylase
VAASIRLEGYALHSGVTTAVTLARREGPLTFVCGSRSAPLESLVVARTDAGVALSDGRGLDLDLAEHLLAALGGLGIRRGVTSIVEGAELPILDGGARRFAEALLSLEPALEPAPADLVVRKSGTLSAGSSRYTFEPGDSTKISVETSFDHPAIGVQRASWDGTRSSFLASIAPARTFGFQTDGPALWKRGRAELAARPLDVGAMDAFARAVVVFAATGAVAIGSQPPPSDAEIARHKLLDVIGDFALYGGPPEGHMFATRPGHTSSHQIIREALSTGILSRR